MKKILLIIGLILLTLTLIGLKPIDTSKENSVEVVGIIKSVSEGGVKDLVFELENDKITYYINRGLENGFELDTSKSNFVGKKVTLNYAKNWTPLAPFGTTCKHITQIYIDNKEVYSEFK
ncbi:hypothetical protein [Flavobacterium sp.]|uniref:hypothetical protein n=1 Tax=Flavobacterium sp. TaxID=239 RepID=UPI00260D3C95|nr:hypothetical protein [Flavobacterium sp.]